jgi:hypothetical protein
MRRLIFADSDSNWTCRGSRVERCVGTGVFCVNDRLDNRVQPLLTDTTEQRFGYDQLRVWETRGKNIFQQ